jgi:undecaprenyl-diphosphatase
MIRGEGSFSKHIPGQLAGLFLLLFAGLTGLVLAGATDRLDLGISRAVAGTDHPWLTTLLGWTTAAAMPLVASLAVPIGWALLRCRARLALLIAASGLGSIALNLLLKLALRHNPPDGGGIGHPIDWHSPLPTVVQQISDSYSYPSGHVETTIVVLGLWLLCLWPLVPRAARVALIITAAAFVSLLAYSRVYLGHHVATDILGGALIAAAWLAGTAWLHAAPRTSAHPQRPV